MAQEKVPETRLQIVFCFVCEIRLSIMDGILWLLASFLLSVLLNVTMIIYLMCCNCNARTNQRTTTNNNNKEIETQKIGAGDTRKRMSADAIVVFTNSGRVFHKTSCKHVHSKEGETKIYNPCKDCFK